MFRMVSCGVPVCEFCHGPSVQIFLPWEQIEQIHFLPRQLRLLISYVPMKLESNTTIASLVSALPSTVVVFSRFGIPIAGSENRTVQEVCRQHNVPSEDLLRAIEELDWDGESPLRPNQNGN